MKNDQKQQIGVVIKRLLKPFVRLLIKFNISHSEFAEYSKQAFAEAAYDHFQIPGKRMTFARVAVLTGLSRKQVIRILSENENSMPLPKITENRAQRVRMGWISDPLFSSSNHRPRVLHIKEGENSFHYLVEKYSGDITAKAILDEMVANGMVEKRDNNTVRLLSAGFTPPVDDIKKLETLSICVGDMLGTGIHNIENSDSDNLRFQREFTRNGVPEGLIDEFRAYTEERSQALLVDYYIG